VPILLKKSFFEVGGKISASLADGSKLLLGGQPKFQRPL